MSDVWSGVSSMDWSQASTWMPMVFFILIGFSVLAYSVLDGYDLGVGMLMSWANESDRDMMVASIGPFWDANETWLVLGVGLLLVAFPEAHGVVLGYLYMPVAFMLVGLTLRGVAFDFRAKAGAGQKPLWDKAFIAGSFLTGFSQGVMCASFVTGFESGPWMWLFQAAVGVGVCGFYAWLGAGWLTIKCHGPLQARSLLWARKAMWIAALAICGVSVATPLASAWVWSRWVSWPRALWLSPIPLLTMALFFFSRSELNRLERELIEGAEHRSWGPFGCTVVVAILCFAGLGYSCFPFVAIGSLTMWQAAADVEALRLEFWGAVVVMPAILGYTVFAYRVFGGKATPLDYH